MYPLADSREEAIEQHSRKMTTIRCWILTFFKRLQYVRQNFRRRASDRQVCNQRPCKRHFDLRKPACAILHSCEGNPALYNSMIENFHGECERRDGEVPAPPRYFIEADMPVGVEEGESYPRDHFIGLKSRRIKALKEIGSRDNALATLRHRLNFSTKTDRASRKFGCGICERQATAECSTIADRGMSHAA